MNAFKGKYEHFVLALAFLDMLYVYFILVFM